jgi:predicted permease
VKEFLIVLGAVLPVFCIAGLVVGLRKLDWLTEEADQSMLRVTVNLLIPSLILDSILGNQALARSENVFLPPVIGVTTVVLGIGLGLLFRRLAGLTDKTRGRTFALSIGIYNYGYVPIPLAAMLFDRETLGVLFVHNVGVETAFWTLGLWMLRRGMGGSGWRQVLSPPVVAIAVALVLNAAEGDQWLPAFVLTAAEMLGQCAIPMGLILVGATMADYLHQFHGEKSVRTMSMACLLRLGLLPVLFLLLAWVVPGSVELKRVMVLQAAMPTAVFSILISKHYGGDPNIALRVVMATSVVALITIPIWLRVGMTWILGE